MSCRFSRSFPHLILVLFPPPLALDIVLSLFASHSKFLCDSDDEMTASRKRLAIISSLPHFRARDYASWRETLISESRLNIIAYLSAGLFLPLVTLRTWNLFLFGFHAARPVTRQTC